MKIVKTVATSCQILRLKCTKVDFGWGSAPCRPRWGAGSYTAPSPRPSWNKGDLLLMEGRDAGDERG